MGGGFLFSAKNIIKISALCCRTFEEFGFFSPRIKTDFATEKYEKALPAQLWLSDE